MTMNSLDEAAESPIYRHLSEQHCGYLRRWQGLNIVFSAVNARRHFLNRIFNHPLISATISGLLVWAMTKFLDRFPNNFLITSISVLLSILLSAVVVLAVWRVAQQLWTGWTWTTWKWRSPIVWTFVNFIGWSGGGGEYGFICFQAGGKNRSRKGFNKIEGYLISNMDNARSEPMYFAIDGMRVLPSETMGIPPDAEFQITIPLGKNIEDRLTEHEMMQRWASFRFVFELDDVRYEREFSKSQIIRQIEVARKVAFPTPVAKVQRKPDISIYETHP